MRNKVLDMTPTDVHSNTWQVPLCSWRPTIHSVARLKRGRESTPFAPARATGSTRACYLIAQPNSPGPRRRVADLVEAGPCANEAACRMLALHAEGSDAHRPAVEAAERFGSNTRAIPVAGIRMSVGKLIDAFSMSGSR